MTINESNFELETNHTHTIPILDIYSLNSRYPDQVRSIISNIISEKECYFLPSINNTDEYSLDRKIVRREKERRRNVK